MNFVEIPLSAGRDRAAIGRVHVPASRPSSGTPSPPRATRSITGFRPEHLELGEVAGQIATIQGTADVVEYLGNEELLHVSVEGKEIVAIVDSSHRVRPGDVVTLKLPIDKLHLFESESGDSILRNLLAAEAVPA